MRVCALCGVMAALLPASAAGAQSPNVLVPGRLCADRPTLRSLGFRWLVQGDANGNATGTMEYRKAGERAWRPSLPLLRVNGEVADKDYHPYTCGNLLAGSILSLKPGTTYDVRVTLKDPDGGGQQAVVTASTRGEPPSRQGERQMHVYPDDRLGAAQTGSAVSLAAAMRRAGPGEVVLLHRGVYQGPFVARSSGTMDRPIVFRAAGDGEAVLQGSGDGKVVEASGRSWLAFEGLTIRGGQIGIKANGAQGLVVRRCRFQDVNSGVITYTTDAADWYVADNDITGRLQKWYPRGSSSDTGVNCCGRGHVVCNNRIRCFWDGVSTDNLGEPKQEWTTAQEPPQTGIDIYGNDISEIMDDGIEADYTLANVRVFENRIVSVHTGLSAQPTFGGPLYLVRNVVYGTTYAPLKLHNHPSGLAILHNTLLGTKQGFESWPPDWQNATLRNNLFVGAERYAVETGTPHPRSSLDYDGFRHSPDPVRFINWSADGGKTWTQYPRLAAFARATGFEKHGVMVDYADFVKAPPPKEGHVYSPADFDLRLKPGSKAVDAGVRLPTVNDGFAGKAPDIGAYEQGAPPLRFGPRG